MAMPVQGGVNAVMTTELCAGTVVLDAGAVRALQKKSSLFATGLVATGMQGVGEMAKVSSVSRRLSEAGRCGSSRPRRHHDSSRNGQLLNDRDEEVVWGTLESVR